MEYFTALFGVKLFSSVAVIFFLFAIQSGLFMTKGGKFICDIWNDPLIAIGHVYVIFKKLDAFTNILAGLYTITPRRN